MLPPQDPFLTVRLSDFAAKQHHFVTNELKAWTIAVGIHTLFQKHINRHMIIYGILFSKADSLLSSCLLLFSKREKIHPACKCSLDRIWLFLPS